MADIIGAISTAISLASRLKKLSDTIREAEFKNLLADLNIQLAETKMQLVDLVAENASLKQRVRDLENSDGEPCPKCRKRTWVLQDSRPDPIFGAVGGVRRTFKCSACGFSEEKLAEPQ